MSAISSPAARAEDLKCYVNKLTDAHTCFDASSVRESNGIRRASLYTGGPDSVRKTSFSVHANCESGVVHLKDADGVSFAGGQGNETDAVFSLRSSICSNKIKIKK